MPGLTRASGGEVEVNSRHGLKLAVLLGIVCLWAVPSAALGAVFVSVTIAPPALPVYAQPLCPGPDYIWMPGYWGYGPFGYYWIPGTWVLAPEPGLLWTPGYWAFEDGLYVWHAGYWGPDVGFYGGVDYGFGYFGNGFVGGEWTGRHFRYNRAVMDVDPAVERDTYVDRRVIRNAAAHRASFNGPGGVQARPTAAESAAAHEHHFAPTAVQQAHRRTASENRNNFVSVNHGRPAVLATSRPTAAPVNRAAPATRAAVNRPPAARTPIAPNRPATRPQPTRPPVANRPSAAANRPPAEARPPVVSRPAAPSRPPANHAAPPRHQQAQQPQPRYNAPPRQVPAPRRAEPARPPVAVNHAAPSERVAPPRVEAPHRAAAPRVAPPPRQEARSRPAPPPQAAPERRQERR